MKFATVVNCMDGRVQLAVIRYLQERFGVDCVDSITEPGPNRILGDRTDPVLVESILNRVRISVEKHGSVGIAVVGHPDCAGNPAPPGEQAAQTARAVALLRESFPGVPVIGLWVGEDWTTVVPQRVPSE